MSENSCRVCLTSESNKIIDIFNCEDYENYADMMSYCSGIEIHIDDQLPQKICLDCSNKVRSACETKRKCIETDSLLRMHLKDEPEDFEPLKFEVQPEIFVCSSNVKAESLEHTPKAETAKCTETLLETEDIFIESKPEHLQVLKFKDWLDTLELPEIAKEVARRDDLKCVFCNKNSKTIVSKRNHMQTHHGDELLCNICNKTCSTVFATELCMKEHRYGFEIVCPICNKHFRRKKSLKIHLLTIHNDIKLFACDLCGTRTKTKRTMLKHILNLHLKPSLKFPCTHASCNGLTYTTVRGLKYHQYRHHGLEAPITCQRCGAGFSKMSELKQHYKGRHCGIRQKYRKAFDQPRQKTRPEDFSCLFCTKVFDLIKIKKQHMKDEHASELFCKVCTRKCKTVLSTEKCMKEHQFGTKHLCQICGKHSRSKKSLDEHLAVSHSEEKPFTCDLCGGKSKRKEGIVRHMRMSHMKREDVGYPCPHVDTCPGVFYGSSKALRYHMYRHHGLEAPIRCPRCNAPFSNSSELKSHSKSSCRQGNPRKFYKMHGYDGFYNIVDGRYHCKVCPKIVSTKVEFSAHYRRKHEDNKTCDICNKTFTDNVSYHKHKKVVHENIKNYRCDFPGCGKSFGYRHGLESHVNNHTGEKPFACNLCNWRTGDRRRLSEHKKKFHSSNPQIN